MRLPTKDGNIDIEEMKAMVDLFIKRGFNYFDTAHGYMDQRSEPSLKEALTSRYKREDYVLVDKLSDNFFNKQEDIVPFFESQLRILGVDYLDLYLMHAQDKGKFEKYKRCKAYETAIELRKQGKIKHFGISFHDTPEVLDQILTEYPEVEFVQIQLNYFDYEDHGVQSRRCYEVCVKHGKPVIVMEPIKGGSLINLPEMAQKVVDELGGVSNAELALRFAGGLENVAMVLSGMGSVAMIDENTKVFKDLKPLNEKELEATKKVTGILRDKGALQCTACRYCMEKCPKGIKIPDLFACLNSKRVFQSWNADYYYNIHTAHSPKASECLKCGLCEGICPQHLPIRKLLEEVAEEFEH